MTVISPVSGMARAASVPRLESTEDIARMNPPFLRALAREFDLAALAGRLCPVLLESGEVAVFAVSEYAVGDQADEIERMARAQGYRLADPPRYMLPATLLLMVARGQLGAPGLGRQSRLRQAERASALSALFLDIVRAGVQQGASDVHINVSPRREQCEIRYTINGEYLKSDRFEGLSHATLLEVLAVAWMDVRGGNGAVFDPAIEQQGRIALELDGAPLVLRWASLATDAGPSVCLRILRLDANAHPGLADLGYLPEQVAALLRARERESGAIVLAGVVGSGKSTTIATLMRGIAASRKVITLEDPVEYLIGNALQNTVSGGLAEPAWPAFEAKLKTIKRSAMNDLLLGEIRDRETGRAFADLAGSGVGLYTTTHAGAAFLIPERLASDAIGVPREFLATPGVLKLLVYQTLLPTLCASCSRPASSLWGAAERRRAPRGDAGLAAVACPCSRMPAARTCRHCESGIRKAAPRAAPADAGANGVRGRSVAAEMIEPERLDGFSNWWRGATTAAFARLVREANQDLGAGAVAALDCALLKVGAGLVDPRALARRFDLPRPLARAPPPCWNRTMAERATFRAAFATPAAPGPAAGGTPGAFARGGPTITNTWRT
ncbi:ATPase, T2SS/T4P/T4SS family [Achromobacter sp. DMS1]|uniref:ATPase, T2SS/T4P/T4SS family n=1 Tax=Achromobacter sp. DMS1 TaxID=1688405 RepID=UPI000A86CBCC|nr:ATPase, T2SS/T4P/T4SS family [Achromobacter sp. DMS1]